MTLAEIIAEYQLESYKIFKDKDVDGKVINQYFVFDNHQDYLNKYLGAFISLDNLTEVIIYAVNGFFKLTNRGLSFFIQHGHQYQWTDDNGNLRGIAPEILKEVRDKLLMNIDAIKAVKDFAALIDVVNENRIRFFGETAIYDTSLRIGSFLNIEPEHVYLHTGAKKGAEELERKGYLPAGSSDRKSIPMEIMPVELQPFKPAYLEHFFCVAKERLANLELKQLSA